MDKPTPRKHMGQRSGLVTFKPTDEVAAMLKEYKERGYAKVDMINYALSKLPQLMEEK